MQETIKLIHLQKELEGLDDESRRGSAKKNKGQLILGATCALADIR